MEIPKRTWLYLVNDKENMGYNSGLKREEKKSVTLHEEATTNIKYSYKQFKKRNFRVRRQREDKKFGKKSRRLTESS